METNQLIYSEVSELNAEMEMDSNWSMIPKAFTLLGRGGGWISPHYFQTSISPWKRGSGGPKFRDFS